MSESLGEEIERLRKRLERERRARQEAEAIAERGTRLLYERAQGMQLLYTIADASSRATSVEAAIQVALDALCAYTGWPVGHAFTVTKNAPYPLVSMKLWHLDNAELFAVFREASDNISFQPGEGLPGRVLASGESVWVRDVTEESNFPRGQVAREAGLRGAFAIPVLVGNNVVAVLEFFAREFAQPDQNWLDVAAQVGTQVGRTFEREARHEADRANRAKSEFLSRMSHELRTPLNAILGFGQLLELEDISPEQRDSVRHILKGGRHLLDLVNEVLNISRIESGHMHFSPEAVHLGDVIRETVDLIRPLAAQRNIPVIGPSTNVDDRHVLADRQRLKQLLLNLLSNAVKYNREGGSVNVECTETGGLIRLNVHDTGTGIPAHKLQRLFRPFERLGAEQGTVEGTGLGLALSKRLAELMGARIGVETALGKGSTFWVEFEVTANPLEVADAAEAPVETTQPPVQPERTVLYIEDNFSNLQLIERLFARRPNLKLLAAMQAGLGLDLAVQHLPDMLLLDLNLPDMSGLEVLARLRTNPHTCEIPVVVISADATTGQISRLLAAGAAAYLTKPLEVPKFLATIDEVLARRNA